MQPFEFEQGRTPLPVSMPHVGTYIPDAIHVFESQRRYKIVLDDRFAANARD